MGYYTSFSLSLSTADPLLQPADLEPIIAEFCKFSDSANCCLDDDGNSNESGKWYDYNQELREFSKQYPTVLFHLEGEGEENTDLWHLYVQNGKAQHCPATITFPEYDASKLQ